MVSISVIICTRNRAEALRRTLEHLRQSLACASVASELVIIDNGSGDHTPQVIKEFCSTHPLVTSLLEPRPGQSRARNSGIRVAASDVILLTDDDIVVPQGWLSAMAEPILRDRADLVAGGVVIPEQLRREWMSQRHRSMLAEFGSADVARGSPCVGANMAFHRRVFDAVGGFDEDMGPGVGPGGEETFFGRRAALAGFRHAARTDVVVEHYFSPERLQRAAFLKTAEAWGKGAAHLAYHWEHSDWRLPHVRRLRFQARLAMRRIWHRAEWAGEEGADIAELDDVQRIAMLRQYELERRGPRKYARHGIKKLAAN